MLPFGEKMPPGKKAQPAPRESMLENPDILAWRAKRRELLLKKGAPLAEPWGEPSEDPRTEEIRKWRQGLWRSGMAKPPAERTWQEAREVAWGEGVDTKHAHDILKWHILEGASETEIRELAKRYFAGWGKEHTRLIGGKPQKIVPPKRTLEENKALVDELVAKAYSGAREPRLRAY